MLKKRSYKLLGICSLIFLLLSFWVPIVYSSITVLDIVPDSPEQGDVVSISIRANPMEELTINIVFQDEIQVTDGLYDYLVDYIHIPSSSNMFSVSADGVSDLHVSIEMPFSVTKSSGSIDGLAFVSERHIPEGRYDIHIHGHALDDVSSVSLEFTAEFTIHADNDGLYEYRYNTKNIPPGVFTVDVNGVTREITLIPREKRWTDYIFPYGIAFVVVGISLAAYFLYKRGYISIEIAEQ